MAEDCVAVLQICKRVTKLSVWSAAGQSLERQQRSNERVYSGGYVALDVQGIEAWLSSKLFQLSTRHTISTIVPIAHGAAASVICRDKLVLAPMDYENPISAGTRVRYEAMRDSFSVTGSPFLIDGLNLGLQLAWLEEYHPNVLRREATILPWAQYWGWILSGIAASEITSLGCHSDLWNPLAGRFSPMARGLEWDKRFAPLRRADAALGPVQSTWVTKTGLSADTRVLCGMHDSNAAFNAIRIFAEMDAGEFTVLSTDTWFVAMRCAEPIKVAGLSLAEHRDCLVNVDWHGEPVPSARFMGGREIEILLGSCKNSIDYMPDQAGMLKALPQVVADGVMVLPTVMPGMGPYPESRSFWTFRPRDDGGKRAAIGLYAALMSDSLLELLGSRERIVIEGRFAQSHILVRALATLRPDCEVFVSYLEDGVAMGALRLARPDFRPPYILRRILPLDTDLSTYREIWQSCIEEKGLQ